MYVPSPEATPPLGVVVADPLSAEPPVVTVPATWFPALRTNSTIESIAFPVQLPA
jgi:hypothetical protein